MNNKAKIALIGVIVVMVMTMMLLLGGSGNKVKNPNRRTYVSSEWDSKFELNDKDPYGLYLFNQLLRSHIDTAKKVVPLIAGSALDSIVEPNSIMVFVGNKFGLQSDEFETVMTKVDQGAHLLLSYGSLTQNLNQRLFKDVQMSYDFEDSINVYVGNSRFTQYYSYQNDTLAHIWKGFQQLEPVDSVVRSLSTFMGMSNFVRIPHGNGFIYLHTTPECFFNYQVQRPDGFRYTAFVLNQLPKDRNVYLLELGRLSDDPFPQENMDTNEEFPGEKDDSYFQFLFQSPSFIAASILTVIGLLLFLIFRSKRMQPVVPYIGKKKNMSLEFAQTITSIYVSKQVPYAVLKLQRKNFYDTVSKHFFIELKKVNADREKDIEALSQKANIDKEEIRSLLMLLETKMRSEVDDNYIVEVSKKQRRFYEQTGVINSRVMQRIAVQRARIQREMLLSSLLILLGTVVIITGSYYLMSAIGVGILLWPIGFVLLLTGILRMSKPLISYDENAIIWYPVLGKKQTFSTKDLMSVTPMKNGVVLNFTGERKVTVNYWEMSRFDRTQFELFITANHQTEI
jgi:hypothetical protein